jgi:hypothetical protein
MYVTRSRLQWSNVLERDAKGRAERYGEIFQSSDNDYNTSSWGASLYSIMQYADGLPVNDCKTVRK